MNIDRKLLLLWFLCIVFIVIALTYKYSQIRTESTKIRISNQSSENKYPVEPSQSFYSSDLPNNQPKSEQIISKNQSIVTALAYIVGNVETGDILLKKNSNKVLPVASMSKIITAIASIDRSSLSGKTSINEDLPVIPDQYNKFKSGEIFTVNELLYPLLLNSSNIAAEILASSSNRSIFMDNMSSYAWEIGMPSTYFADPSGINPKNISSAIDFFALARYLYKSRPDILAITRTKNFSISTTTEHGYHEFTNIHPFVTDPRFIGGKTGHTDEAKDTMLTIMNIKNQPIAIIVLGSEDRKSDTTKLLQLVEAIIN